MKIPRTYVWVLCKSWQLVFGQQCGKIGNGVYNFESMHHVLAMFQSYKGTCAEVHMCFKHKYHSTDSFIQTWKSTKQKRLYIKRSILHGRNPRRATRCTESSCRTKLNRYKVGTDIHKWKGVNCQHALQWIFCVHGHK